MKFANEYDIQQYLSTFDDGSTPNLFKASVILNNLADWADSSSDGWACWPKPSRSAASLITLLEDARQAWLTGGFLADVSEADVRRVCSPIKAFLTREGVDHDESEIFPVVVKNPCRECGEDTGNFDPHTDWGFCASCLHDALRSGWTPGE